MGQKPADRTRRHGQATDALAAQVDAMSREIETLRTMLDMQRNWLALLTEIKSAEPHNQRDAGRQCGPSASLPHSGLVDRTTAQQRSAATPPTRRATPARSRRL